MSCRSHSLANMSFFNSLQQYVTSGVAGLGLSPRRFSLSRQESTEPPAQERRESNNSQQHHGEFLRLALFLYFLSILEWHSVKVGFGYLEHFGMDGCSIQGSTGSITGLLLLDEECLVLRTRLLNPLMSRRKVY